MSRSYQILPVYAGDVSGACSALFELGGMVVIHDPSGCNSTYNTHDETRWYDHDSLIFISALRERDAILGNDDKLVRDVVDAARELRPRFVALCNSPIPFITGTDFAALCRIIERQTGIPCFYVATNGMHDYVVGAGNALAAVAEHLLPAEPSERRPKTLNVLGVTPLDFFRTGAPARLRDFCTDAGFRVTSCWAMGSRLDELMRAGSASVNLVVSATGLAAAQVLRRRYGTPYVVGRPQGGGPFDEALAQALRDAGQTGDCAWPCRDLRVKPTNKEQVIMGEPVAAASEAAAVELAGSEPLRVVCTVETKPELLARRDVLVDGEDEVRAACAQARTVYADPFYREVLPAGAKLVSRPHLAFSGRNALAVEQGAG